MTKVIRCAACNAEAPKGEDWYVVHFSSRNLELLATATQSDIQYLGERSACSRECLLQLVRDWSEHWPARKAVAAAQ